VIVHYRQICPVSLASEIIAERWTPLILREIVLLDRHHFSEIQRGVGQISQSLLSARLRALVDAGILQRRPNRSGRGSEYFPTTAGRELEQVLNELALWAQHWIALRREHCDPASLMQTMLDVLRLDRMPPPPVTVRFEFTADPRIYWLVIDGEHPELCFYDPGREVDLVVTLDEQVFGGVLLGRISYAEATHRDGIRLDGPPELVRAFPTWIGATRFAKYGRNPDPLAQSAALVAG
jgi:DNA-binding HxlR family transcriptional regulator